MLTGDWGDARTGREGCWTDYYETVRRSLTRRRRDSRLATISCPIHRFGRRCSSPICVFGSMRYQPPGNGYNEVDELAR